jgi:tRNA dimethylallyltransferase
MDVAAILGPTAVGKSAVGASLAEELDGEIISVDSRQAYRLIDIGTAKPSRAERDRVPHHLIDILDLTEKNNADNFAGRAEEAIDEIVSRDRLPILVGGSGLYFRAIFDGFFRVRLDPDSRAEFAESIKGVPTEELLGRLRDVDEESGNRIHPNDRYRIVRALEVYAISGVPLTEHFKRQRAEKRRTAREFLKVGLHMERSELYRRINGRVIDMIEAGWIDEVEQLLEQGHDPDSRGLKTLGYPEIIAFIRGEIGKEAMIERISRLTRQYAKRQLTWFKRERGVRWFRMDDPAATGKILTLVKNSLG